MCLAVGTEHGHSGRHKNPQRTAKLVKGARLHVVNGGPHCVIWTLAEEVNAELVSFLGEDAEKAKCGGA
jgi:pimeloyl-ACP methyl ester carboxylesterase